MLRRDDRELQFGLDPDTALILAGLPPAFDPLLELIDGTRSSAELRTAGRDLGLDAAVVDAALRTLRTSGLLERPGPGPAPVSTVRLIGAGPLGRAIGTALVAAGPEAGIFGLELSDPRTVDASLYPAHPLAGSQAEALRAELQDKSRPRHPLPEDRPRPAMGIGPHWSEFGGPGGRHRSERATERAAERAIAPALTVVTAETTETDRAITDALMRADQPHLVVRPWLGGALLGPLVVPGRSPCLGCLDLTRTGADPAWPRLLDQLSHHGDRADPVSLGWAAATATTQLVRWLRTGDADLVGATMEVTPPDYAPRLRRWSMHPGCGCSWPLAARWAS